MDAYKSDDMVSYRVFMDDEEFKLFTSIKKQIKEMLDITIYVLDKDVNGKGYMRLCIESKKEEFLIQMVCKLNGEF